jgi:iron complex outermembrane receptor protein
MEQYLIRALRPLLLCTATAASLSALAADGGVEAAPEQRVMAEVIVTAERRPVDVQSVPVSVSVLREDELRSFGLRESVNLTAAVPGLQFGQQGMGATPFIRGVGAASGAVGNEAPVSIYVDGVYIASPTAGIFNLAGVQQIEVLKGPQSTLFGRNTTGGVIQAETRLPETEPMAELGLRRSSFSTTQASAYVTAGLGESARANLSLHYRDQQDGWGTNLSTGEPTFRHEEFGARTKLEWSLGSQTRLLLGASHFDREGEDGIGYHLYPGSLGVDGQTGYSGFYNSWANPQDRAGYRHDVLSARVEHDHAHFRLVNILSWQQLHAFFRLDQDETPARIIDAQISQYSRTITEELQLMSRHDASLPWIVGMYYLNDLSAYDPLTLEGAAIQPLTSTRIHSQQQSDSYSVFGQATVHVTPRTHLTLGARYTRDERSIDGATLGMLDDDRVPLTATRQSDAWDRPTWRVALSREVTSDLMAYVSWDRGFKSGVYNLLSYAAAAVNPEELDAYQAGVKSDWLQRRLRLNIAGFYYDYRNIQVESIVAGATIAMNAAEARMRGAEIDVQYLLSDRLSTKAAVSLLDGTYTDFRNAPINVPNRDSNGNLVGGNTVTSGDATDNRTVRSPRTSMMLQTRYDVPTHRGEFGLNIAYAYSSRFAWDPDNRLQQDAYGDLSASLDWLSPRQTFTVRLSGSNLTNSEVCVLGSATAVGDFCSPRAPRLLSVELSCKL